MIRKRKMAPTASRNAERATEQALKSDRSRPAAEVKHAEAPGGERTYDLGYNQGYEQGFSAGFAKGYEDGLESEYAKG